MLNASGLIDHGDLPPLPAYQLVTLPSFIPYIPDKVLTILLPFAAYWCFSLFFHWIDENDYFPQYRLHTPAEVLKRNRVSKWEVIRDVLIQQVVQTIVGLLLGMTDPKDTFGKEDFDIAVWARRVRIAQRVVPGVLSTIGVNSKVLASRISYTYPALAGVLLGGQYPPSAFSKLTGGGQETGPKFASWEILLAVGIYHLIVPALQFGLGIVVVDTWQYFWHRAMHMNKWLYSGFFKNSI